MGWRHQWHSSYCPANNRQIFWFWCHFTHFYRYFDWTAPSKILLHLWTKLFRWILSNATKHRRHFFLISKTFFYENGNNLIEMERKRYHLAFNTACMRFFPASLHFLRIKKMPNLSLWFFFWYRCHNDVFFASFNLIKVFSPWNFTCRIYIYCLTMQGHFFQFVIFKWIGAF